MNVAYLGMSDEMDSNISLGRGWKWLLHVCR